MNRSRNPLGSARPDALLERSPNLRIRLQALMLVVLTVALNLGLGVWLSDRRTRETLAVAESAAQQNAAFLILNLPDPVVRQLVPVGAIQWGGQCLGTGRAWDVPKRAWVVEHDKRRDLIDIEVSGGASGTHVNPILIKARAGELNAHFIGRLSDAFQARKWVYRIVPEDGHGAE